MRYRESTEAKGAAYLSWIQKQIPGFFSAFCLSFCGLVLYRAFSSLVQLGYLFSLFSRSDSLRQIITVHLQFSAGPKLYLMCWRCLLHHQTSHYKLTGVLLVQEDICISFPLPYCSVSRCSLQMEKGINGLFSHQNVETCHIFRQTFVVLSQFVLSLV